jgi:hypothetical protein
MYHTQFKSEASQALRKWGEVADLYSIADEHERLTIAGLIENQSTLCQITENDPRYRFTHHMFNNPECVVKRMYSSENFIGFDIVSVQMMLGPCMNVISTAFGDLRTEPSTAKSRKLKACPWTEGREDSLNFTVDEITMEYNREIICDIKNNCGVVAETKLEKLHLRIEDVADRIETKTQRPNWIICGTDILEFLTGEKLSGDSCMKIFKSEWYNYKLFVDPLFVKNTLVLGYKGKSSYGSPYIYCPYLPYTPTPVIFDPDSFCARLGIIARYAKKLFMGGKDFYGKITITP